MDVQVDSWENPANHGKELRLGLWEVATGREVRTVTGHPGWVLGVAFSPHGRWLASAGQDSTLKLWRLRE